MITYSDILYMWQFAELVMGLPGTPSLCNFGFRQKCSDLGRIYVDLWRIMVNLSITRALNFQSFGYVFTY